MFSRRQLRIKALQSLYSFFIAENEEIKAGEKNLLQSIETIHDLYLSQMALIVEIGDFARRTMEDAKQKYFPTEDEKDPNTKFIDNTIIKTFASNKEFNRLLQNKKISWSENIDLVKKIFQNFRNGEDYIKYLSDKKKSLKSDQEIIISLVRDYLNENDLLEQLYDEKNIYYVDELDFVNSTIIKSVLSLKIEDTNGYEWIYPGRATPEEIEDNKADMDFMLALYRKTILKSTDFEKLISEKAKNWESERIALIDMIIMKMALCELTEFPSIPIKVTLNEYIELSKCFSSQKSKVFINGILDKLVEELKNANKINKTGRGLME